MLNRGQPPRSRSAPTQVLINEPWYNSATGWSRITGSHMRLAAVILGVLGIIIAAGNVWAFFIQWLSLLGVVVPPVGAIILVDQYVVRPGAQVDADYRPLAFGAWAIGSAVAFTVEKGAPEYSTAISAMIVGGIAYWALCGFKRSSTQPV